MIEIVFKPSFVRTMNGLERALADEAIEKIEMFKDPKNHQTLKVHKLHGKLSGRHSFSVNYKFRIVFEYISKDTARFLVIGDHDIYL